MNAFSLQAVHLVVEDCPLGKLAAFGHPKSKPFEFFKDVFDDSPASMNLQFNDVLTIVAALAWVEYYYALVE